MLLLSLFAPGLHNSYDGSNNGGALSVNFVNIQPSNLFTFILVIGSDLLQKWAFAVLTIYMFLRYWSLNSGLHL
jgi:hypothetical protein